MEVSYTITNLIIFVLAIYVGYHVVWTVTPALHTPLMASMLSLMVRNNDQDKLTIEKQQYFDRRVPDGYAAYYRRLNKRVPNKSTDNANKLNVLPHQPTGIQMPMPILCQAIVISNQLPHQCQAIGMQPPSQCNCLTEP
jgi:hypothetical protein